MATKFVKTGRTLCIFADFQKERESMDERMRQCLMQRVRQSFNNI